MAGFIGVLLGALIAIIGMRFTFNTMMKEFDRREIMKEKMREIDALNLLNHKIQEILQKRDVLLKNAIRDVPDYQILSDLDNVMITIDDFIYLQSFCAQNHYYLPTFMVEEFFSKISHRKVVMDPEQIRKVGAYTYKGGRLVLEEFSDQLMQMINDRKIELRQYTKRRYI
ncbi:hypothetical protein K5X77_01105 [Vagococcus lutrae]|uniref:Uncharacterized protein n=1 Tax=Vagococcus lutrae TaxID=81947 RepID=A0AAE9XEV5_9ENTE|nr:MULTISPECIES: hypothetical protein [Vagococcus]MCO7151944.1 hypothetical protein [Vagococcus lutrae]MDO5741688.1 hypothetical protein [Vagococcus sp.]MDT2801093.1 hypothetical protein [Vagococcus lutrae]MDT2806758.1 hypothetical protein [Vagococcus lutrae]MDT2808611.1 hypothetical protein [Vagococcus lutrae]